MDPYRRLKGVLCLHEGGGNQGGGDPQEDLHSFCISKCLVI